MKEYGFIRVGAGIPTVEVANCKYNIDRIYEIIQEANQNGIMVLTFPELSVTGYTCGDLFLQQELIDSAETAVAELLEKTKMIDMLIVVGAPVSTNSRLFNCAIAMHKGEILGIVPKTYIPNYGEFYEKRWFSSAFDYPCNIKYCGKEVCVTPNVLFQHSSIKELCIGIEICEDLWSTIPPSTYQALDGATLILNLSASNEYVGKNEYRRTLVEGQSSKCMCAYVYASSGFGESSTDLVFSGHSMICENGAMLAESKRFLMENQLIYSEIDVNKLYLYRQKNKTFGDCSDKTYASFDMVVFNSKADCKELIRHIDGKPFIPKDEDKRSERCNEIFNIQTAGLIKRFKHINAKSMVLGVSGGLDSTLALLVCARACDKLGIDRSAIKAITMPGFGTTDRTYNNAVEMIKRIGATFKEISIKESVLQHFQDIGHDREVKDLTYENSQARERTQILMDVAGKEGGFVVGTGDLSELVLGWATYNGDHMSMYAVNASIPKTLIRYIVKWAADNEFVEDIKNILYDVLDTPVSPELLPPDKDGKIAQKTEDLVGPYELHDFFIYNCLRFGYKPSKIYKLACIAFKDAYDEETVYKWLEKFYYRFFSQQFKRSCMPDGPKVGSVCLSPRGDLRMPSDAVSKAWIDDLEKVKREVNGI